MDPGHIGRFRWRRNRPDLHLKHLILDQRVCRYLLDVIEKSSLRLFFPDKEGKVGL